MWQSGNSFDPADNKWISQKGHKAFAGKCLNKNVEEKCILCIIYVKKREQILEICGYLKDS
ncbi:hypothetical protein EROP_06930 [Erysipelotrichaceae bacterium OPF54]|nr:hypothetical protein EROP_06930 [Erysipelotrichaceae bacterium OPF54]